MIAWLWARTVKSPNPAFAQVDVPLASTFMLSTKEGKEAYVEPVMFPGSAGILAGKDAGAPGYRFTVKIGKPKEPGAARLGTTAGKRSAFLCVMSGAPIDYDHIRAEGKAGRMGARLMAIVAEGEHGRIYLSPGGATEAVSWRAHPEWRPEAPLCGKCRVNVSLYGLDSYGDLFTPRQLVALTTFSDLVQEARELVRRDAVATGMPDGGRPLASGGAGASAYATPLGCTWRLLFQSLQTKARRYAPGSRRETRPGILLPARASQ